MLPLAGLRIVAVEQYGAGPIGTQLLADLGAEVIKIENPQGGGDISRSVGPYRVPGAEPSQASLFFQGLNRNKRSVTLDLAKPESRGVLHDLVRDADVVADNLRGDVPGKLGITYQALGPVKPSIVCAHLTAYGRSGPRAAWPGYDYLIQAETGYFSINGEPGTPPSRFGLSIVDFTTGYLLAVAILAGVVEARARGRGRDLDVSLFDAGLANLNYLATWHLNAGHVQRQEARSAHPSLTPCQLYKTADGWIYVMANKEKFWPILCAALGTPELAADDRFRDYPARLKNRDALTALLDQAFGRATTAEWLERLSAKVPVAPVLDIAAALRAPFVTESDRVIAVPLPDGRDVRLVNSPIRCDADATPARAAPRLGADTDAVLAGLGYAPERVAALRARGVV